MSTSRVVATKPSRSARAGGAGYDPAPVEARWRARWDECDAFAVPGPESAAEPVCVLGPSAAASRGPRMGHVRGCTIADAYVRFLRARGRAVLFAPRFDGV